MRLLSDGAGIPLSKLPRHTSGRTFGHCVWLGMQQAPYTADVQRNRVSNQEPSAPKDKTLPLGHRGLVNVNKWNFVAFNEVWNRMQKTGREADEGKFQARGEWMEETRLTACAIQSMGRNV
ncbi:hypothetical protein AVEN_224083-1 [Araneus ventricosus]|uniref:Uncharacterized protein n=1 Tax=Araneus ventricosus TaxID=182803 RepID=A0A4Y2IYU6_ARAVE|nr:hypothetical protein AVEN_224083-1 [Araneus ventricosus]